MYPQHPRLHLLNLSFSLLLFVFWQKLPSKSPSSKEIVRDFLIIISLGSMYINWVSSATLILITAAYSWRICTKLSILQLSQTRFPRINKEFPLLFVWVYRDRFTFDRCLSSDWWNSWIFLACHTSITGSFLFFSYNLL